MTDSQKIDLLLEKMDSIEGKVTNIEGRMTNIEGRMTKVEGELSTLKNQVKESTAELKAMDEMILNEVARVHRILDRHIADKTVHIA